MAINLRCKLCRISSERKLINLLAEKRRLQLKGLSRDAVSFRGETTILEFKKFQKYAPKQEKDA